jgi:hypothetical protein
MKTLLQIVQQFCQVTGVAVPTAVVSSTDSQIVQILGLLNEGLDEMVVKYDWSQLEKTATFTSTAVESQGTVDSIAPGLRSIIPNTFWSETNRLPSYGSITPQDTQILKIWGTPSALTQFRQVGNELHFIPAIAAGLQYSFEFRSQYAVLSSLGVPKQYFTADDDTPILPDYLHTLDLRWRWKAEKELAYAENMRSFEFRCKQAAADGATKPPLSMGSSPKQAIPGIVVPIGSWQA